MTGASAESQANMQQVPPSVAHHTVIEPTRGLASLRLRDVWAYRELWYFLAWRDVKVRYKQTALGVAWIVLQPVVSMGIFTVLFGLLLGVSSGTLVEVEDLQGDLGRTEDLALLEGKGLLLSLLIQSRRSEESGDDQHTGHGLLLEGHPPRQGLGD